MVEDNEEPLCAECCHDEGAHLSDYAVPTACQEYDCYCGRFVPPYNGWIGIYGIYKL